MSVAPTIAVIKASCVDGRERIAEASLRVTMFLLEEIRRGNIVGDEADCVRQIYEAKGFSEAELQVAFFRPAASGGGWSESGRRDIKTVQDNHLPLTAIISARHNTCKSVGKRTHLTDPDIAVMIVQDCAEFNVPLPPVYRAHLEVNSKHMVFEPMNIASLVAHAIRFGQGPYFDSIRYSADQAGNILNLPNNSDEVCEIARRVELKPNGLIVPSVPLND